MKIKISRREAKESIYWLSLILVYENEELNNKRKFLIDEAGQVVKILSAILIKLS